jgi:hypothetical protein
VVAVRAAIVLRLASIVYLLVVDIGPGAFVALKR